MNNVKGFLLSLSVCLSVITISSSFSNKYNRYFDSRYEFELAGKTEKYIDSLLADLPADVTVSGSRIKVDSVQNTLPYRNEKSRKYFYAVNRYVTIKMPQLEVPTDKEFRKILKYIKSLKDNKPKRYSFLIGDNHCGIEPGNNKIDSFSGFFVHNKDTFLVVNKSDMKLNPRQPKVYKEFKFRVNYSKYSLYDDLKEK
ncbi:MAG: hypothetical protein K2M07_03465 [Muribaculaceae bacterium]|nr:hypothetical protein [Muribaculaceae bacterium]